MDTIALLLGTNTATPTFTSPVVSTDTVLGFSLRVMDNHVAISANPAVVYVMVKHNTHTPLSSGAINQQTPPPNTFFYPPLTLH